MICAYRTAQCKEPARIDMRDSFNQTLVSVELWAQRWGILLGQDAWAGNCAAAL